MSNVAEWKIDTVNELRQMISAHQTIAVVKIDRIPGSQLQQIRSQLRETLKLKVAKKTLIEMALEGEKEDRPNLQKLTERMDGQAALLATDMNPFSLYKVLSGSMQPMPAKGGEVAQEDIVVSEGETSFPPGPIVGELGKVGIPAAIDKGKVIIRKTTTPVKKGDVISRDMAQALTKLQIFPFKVGIVLDGAWEDGFLYRPEDLDIDMDAYRTDLAAAAQMAFNLAVFTAYATPQTIVPIIARARMQALSLAVNAGIVNKESAEIILSKAFREALALASVMGADALDDDLRALLAGAASAAPPAAPAADGEAGPQKVEEEKEEEAPSEEEAMAGLGALFG